MSYERFASVQPAKPKSEPKLSIPIEYMEPQLKSMIYRETRPWMPPHSLSSRTKVVEKTEDWGRKLEKKPSAGGAMRTATFNYS